MYYAVATLAANNSATYDTPVALPGAVSLTLDPEGDNNIELYVQKEGGVL